MELKKTSENINRSYDADNNMTERVDNCQYEIIDNDGKRIGNANIGTGYANAQINLNGFSSIAEGEAALALLLGD